MKKLLIAACAMALATVANAAAMTWSSSTEGILLPNGVDFADGNVTMYLYEISATDYAGFTGTADEISKAVFAAYGTSSENNAVDEWGVAQLSDSRSFASGETAYAAVVFTYTDGEQEYYKGNIAAYTYTSASDFQVSALDVSLGGDSPSAVGGAIAWQAAPEPTSGLLLLIGMAGLALKRKRA